MDAGMIRDIASTFGVAGVGAVLIFLVLKALIEKGFRIEEYHHPLQQVYERYPRAILMEVRMLEQLLGTKVHRREIPGSKGIPSRVDYEVSTLGSP